MSGWRKASYSSGNCACIEVSDRGAVVLVRDSKYPHGGHLSVDRAPFAVLIEGAKAGLFDDFAAGSPAGGET